MVLNKARVELTRMLARNLSANERAVLVNALDPSGAEAKVQLEQFLAKHKEEVSKLESNLGDRMQLDRQLESAQQHAKAVEAENRKLKEELAAKTAQERELKRAETHPIFGKLLYDFGYKKVFASEPKRLIDKIVLPVWERQRIFRVDRAKAIAKFKRDDPRFGFPGVITIFDRDEPGKRGIVDGQHRIGGLELLMAGGEWPADRMVLTEVYNVADETKEVGDLFREINQAQPALEVDMPGAADDRVKAAIDEASELLMTDFPNMFKPSQQCRAPHLNVDKFRQELFESDKARKVIADAPRDDAEGATKALLAWILARNEALAARAPEEWASSNLVRTKNSAALEKALAKCQSNQFYLGLDLSWL